MLLTRRNFVRLGCVSATPSANWQDGHRFDNGVSQKEIDSWVASF